MSATVSQVGPRSSTLAPTRETGKGPLYLIVDRPIKEGKLIQEEDTGDRLLVRGQVRNTRGEPVPSALLDVWQADGDGNYHEKNLRGQIKCGLDGSFNLWTCVPGYELTEGRPGSLVPAGTRMPLHIHLRIVAEGHKELVTKIFFAHDPVPDPVPDERKRRIPALDISPTKNETLGMLEALFDIVLTPTT